MYALRQILYSKIIEILLVYKYFADFGTPFNANILRTSIFVFPCFEKLNVFNSMLSQTFLSITLRDITFLCALNLIIQNVKFLKLSCIV